MYSGPGFKIIAAGRTAAIAPRRIVLALLAFSISSAAASAELVGEVVSVADGDTITVLDADREKHRIRLSGIDAPERRQAYGERSKQHLAALVFRKTVHVFWDKRDRYARIVGRVYAAECERACPYSIDVGLEQIRAGLAWHYRQYAREQPPRDRERYAESERRAREQREGLWSDTHPVAPWQFRH